MKLLRRLISFTVTLAVLMTLAAPRTVAEEKYTYTVRIYAGQQGTIVNPGDSGGKIENQGDVLVCENIPYTHRIRFSNNMVSLKEDSKYYVKGLRESGKGTEEVSETGRSGNIASFTVDRDQDYVVAYGVLINPVQYTINYQTADGRELAPSETYYGNVGDRPVIAYQYIDGYQPQAYNLTKTLSENPAENVFTFIYSPLPDNTVYTTTTTTTTVVSETTPTTPPDDTSSASGASSATASASSSEASSQPEEDIPDNSVPETQPEIQEPKQNWDLDDGPVPMANFNGVDEKLNSDGRMLWNNIPLAAKIAGGVVMLGGFSVALWLLIFHRRRKDEE